VRRRAEHHYRADKSQQQKSHLGLGLRKDPAS